MVSEDRVRLTMIQTDPKAHFRRQEGIILNLSPINTKDNK